MPEYAAEHPEADPGAAARGQRLGNPAMSSGTQDFLTGAHFLPILPSAASAWTQCHPSLVCRGWIKGVSQVVYLHVLSGKDAVMAHEDVCMSSAQRSGCPDRCRRHGWRTRQEA